MKKLLKILGIGIGTIVLAGILYGVVVNEALPEGKSGPEADALAQKMLTALNQEAYERTRFLEWSFQGGKNQYTWDKAMGKCTVNWGDYKVKLHLQRPKESTALKNGKPLTGAEESKTIEKALAHFNNDSFWLVAPYKVFDKGTTRSIVELQEGNQGLLVTYASGGTTPGDSYLWKLNPDGFPNSYKMWVQILPIGGLEASWDDWMVVDSGAFLPKSHQLGPLELSMGEVKGYND
ncbi:MAG: hypothetical protein AAGC45_07010 [Bacteroidota bacterium]